jgi:seryl-tRNA synthetase
MDPSIEDLIKANAEMKAWIQEYNAHKQSVNRMSARLHKLCKRLSPTSETVLHMQRIAAEIKELAKEATS